MEGATKKNISVIQNSSFFLKCDLRIHSKLSLDMSEKLWRAPLSEKFEEATDLQLTEIRRHHSESW